MSPEPILCEFLWCSRAAQWEARALPQDEPVRACDDHLGRLLEARPYHIAPIQP